jgi:TolB-like protein
MIRFDGYEADLESREVRQQGVKVKLADKSFEVLAMLLEHPGALVRREELRARLWPEGVFVDFENNLNAAVAKLRDALGDSSGKPKFIETLPRRGYRFIGCVSEPAASSAEAGARKRRLAVLPFENLSGDPAQEYFSDGMTEEMITELAALAPERLGVIARTSAMHYKGSRKDVAEIGRELDLDYVVEGSVRRSQGRVRISAQLVQVSDQTHLWASNYDAELSDVLQLQSQVAQAIARHIEIVVSPGESRTARPVLAVSPEAHDAYIRGLYEFNKCTPSSLIKAVEYLERAIEIDPRYVSPYQKLAVTHALSTLWGHAPGGESLPKAADAATRVLQIDQAIPEAHFALGMVHWFAKWDLAGTQRDFERAVELNPNEPYSHWALAMLLGSMMEDHRRAAAEARLARELDPLSIIIRSQSGWLLYWARQFGDAMAHARATLEMDGNNVQASYVLGYAATVSGRFQEAIAAFRGPADRYGDPFSLGGLAMAYGFAGESENAHAAIRRMEAVAEAQHVPAMCFAWAHLGFGNHERTIDWLEKSYAEHDVQVLFSRVTAVFDCLRNHPRYRALICKLPLPPLPLKAP